METLKNIKVAKLISNAKIIFWDFDGVIKESVNIKTHAFMQLFEKYGEEVVKKVKNHHENNGGMSRFLKFPLYLKWSGIKSTNEVVQKLSKEFNEITMHNVINSNWVPGVEEYIRSNSNKQTFILVSATPQIELDYIVNNLNLKKCFDQIFGSPFLKSEVIKNVLNKYNINSNLTLMIGDALLDYESALVNKVPFLFRLHETNSMILNHYNGYIIKDFKEI